VRQIIVELLRPIAWVVARLYFRIRFEGVEHVPRTGPLLLFPNHVSYADPVLVTIPLRRPIHYLAWDRLFRVRLLGRLSGWLRAFPLNIDAPDARAVRQVIRLVRSGEAVVIFPEGGRSADGHVQPLQPGAIRLALRLGVPVCLVSIAGVFDAWPQTRRFPRPGRVRITFHPPWVPGPANDLRRQDGEVERLAEEIRAKLQRGLVLPPALAILLALSASQL
jgi:1-acyl-sn-glycerol-3-phosphate acyltransferase